MRREFSKKIKLAAWERSGGRCETCTAKLFPGNTHYDHLIPDGLGGEPTLANCRAVCRACHGVKTAKEDVPAIAKAKRRQLARAGIKKRKRHSWGYGKDDPMKKKITGEVVPRERAY